MTTSDDHLMPASDRHEVVHLLIAYRYLAREQELNARHTGDYWSNEVKRTETALGKLGWEGPYTEPPIGRRSMGAGRAALAHAQALLARARLH